VRNLVRSQPHARRRRPRPPVDAPEADAAGGRAGLAVVSHGVGVARGTRGGGWWDAGRATTEGRESMDHEVLVQVDEAGADPERVDAVTRLLRAELVQLDVEDVSAVRGGPAPEGSRAFDVIAAGGLLVSLGSSQMLRSLVSTVRGWLTRSPAGGRTVRIEVDGDVLELSDASREDQQRLVEMFLDRHAREAPPP
jgi:hypothetical protein